MVLDNDYDKKTTFKKIRVKLKNLRFYGERPSLDVFYLYDEEIYSFLITYCDRPVTAYRIDEYNKKTVKINGYRWEKKEAKFQNIGIKRLRVDEDNYLSFENSEDKDIDLYIVEKKYDLLEPEETIRMNMNYKIKVDFEDDWKKTFSFISVCIIVCIFICLLLNQIIKRIFDIIFLFLAWILTWTISIVKNKKKNDKKEDDKKKVD